MRCLCVKGFPFVVFFAERGFPKVADWLKVQWSLVVKSWEANGWALAEDAELWLVEVLRRSQTRVELGDKAWQQNLNENTKLTMERK